MQRIRLLLIDDDRFTLEALGELLRCAGYEVLCAASAEEGLALLEASPCAGLISDYQLPGMDGMWLIREAAARALVPAGCSILITAHPFPASEGVPVLRKPFEFSALLSEIARRFGRSE